MSEYRYCVVLPCGGDADAFGRTAACLAKAADFDRTLLVLLSEKTLYEADEYLFAATEVLPAQNLKYLCGRAEAERILPVIRESGCEIAVFLEEGDRVGRHFLEYTGYFFEDTGGRCGLAVAPAAFRSALFADVPAGGIKTLGADDVLPISAKGTAVLVSALEGAAFPPASAAETFLYAALRTALRDGCIGLLPAIEYDGGEPARPRASLVLKELAKEFADESGALPEILRRRTEAYIREQFPLPLEVCDADAERLFPYVPSFAESVKEGESLPRAEIRSVSNHFDDVRITGLISCAAADGEPRLSVRAPARLLAFETENTARCFADRLFPTLRFSALLKPDGEAAANLRFFQGRRAIKNIVFPEQKGRTRPFQNYEFTLRKTELTVRRIAPRAFYRVSCIVPAFNEEAHLAEAAESVVSQTLGFLENIQLILADDGSTDGTARICAEYKEKYPYNVCCVSRGERRGASAARNSGLRLALGEYVAFLDADDKLDPEMLKAGADALARTEEADVAAFPTRRFGTGAEGMDSSLDFIFRETAVIDLEKDPHCVLFSACAAVFRREATEDAAFDEKLRFSEDAAFMHGVLLKKMKYIALRAPAYLYRTDGDGNSAARGRMLCPGFYEKCRVFGETLAARSVESRGIVTDYTQHLLAHELLGALTDEAPEKPLPLELVSAALAGITASLRGADDRIIEASKTLPDWFKYFLLKLKRGKARLERGEGPPVFRADGEALSGSASEPVISALIERGGVLRVSGRYGRSFREEFSLVAFCGGQCFTAMRAEQARREMFFLGCLACEEFGFTLEIPSAALLSGGRLRFALRGTGEAGDRVVSPRFGENAGMSGEPHSFFAGASVLLTREEDGVSFRAEAITNERLAEAFFSHLSGARGDPADGRAAEAKRLFEEYLRMRPLFAESRVWLFMDDARKAGSNAEHMFAYCAGLRDGIDKYFVIGKDSLDGLRLAKTGATVEYGSDTHKLLCLFAEKNIVSEVGEDGPSPIEPAGLRGALGGLLNSETVLLPRGALTKEYALTLRRRAAPIGFLSVVSEAERRLAVSAGGLHESVVYAAGSPAYDLLTDKDRRRILFMPAHREKLCPEEGVFDPNFADSAYCKAINELLCDERLFDAAEKHKYGFDFAPHERIYLQISDFEMDEIVNIVPPGRARRALFEEASLLVTDCVPAFDMACMKKPVIHFRFAEEDELPGGCRFDEEASFPGGLFLGEVVEDVKSLVTRLLSYMKKGCAARDARPADAFFAHADKNSRERIYGLLCGPFRRGSPPSGSAGNMTR